MKKLSVFIVIWIALISLVYLLYSDENASNDVNGNVKGQINNLADKFDGRLYKAFYSIDELRPFSIVQIDKVIESYNEDGKWMSPEAIISELNDKDKNKLKDRVIEYIESFEPGTRRSIILDKLESWCKADAQFDFINNELGIYRDSIIETMHQLNVGRGMISKYYDFKSIPKNELTNEQKEFAYYQTINLLSNMKFADQLKYYSDMYNQLSNICSK